MEQLNSSNSSSFPAPPGSWSSRGLVPAVMLSLCFALGAPGNIAVIILRPNWHQLSSVSRSLMLNLAVSDLLCLLTLPLWIYAFLFSWTLGLGACKLLAYLVYCSLYGSLLTVTALSVQRCLQVVYLQKCFDQVGQKRLLLLLWLVVMILSIPTLVVSLVTRDQGWTECRSHHYSQAQDVAMLLIESLVGSYVRLQRKVTQATFFTSPQTTRLVTRIILSSFVLWLPHHVINVLGVAASWLNNKGLLAFCMNSWNITGALVFVNSCLNPLLYAFASRSRSTVCRSSAFP